MRRCEFDVLSHQRSATKLFMYLPHSLKPATQSSTTHLNLLGPEHWEGPRPLSRNPHGPANSNPFLNCAPDSKNPSPKASSFSHKAIRTSRLIVIPLNQITLLASGTRYLGNRSFRQTSFNARVRHYGLRACRTSGSNCIAPHGLDSSPHQLDSVLLDSALLLGHDHKNCTSVVCIISGLMSLCRTSYYDVTIRQWDRRTPSRSRLLTESKMTESKLE